MALLKRFCFSVKRSVRFLLRSENVRQPQKSRHFSLALSNNESTIFALSSGHGKCGVAVIRVSGAKTKDVIQCMTKRKSVPREREAILQTLYDPESKEPLDKGLLLYFSGPKSFTGEDCCEFHVHGGSAVIVAMFEALLKVENVRHAEAGEFTKRAFMNGKLDLTEVEGVADIIHAETEAQRKQALNQMGGALSNLYTSWRKDLLKCLANIEAYIDFGEDQHIEEDVLSDVTDKVHRLLEDLHRHLKDSRQGERLRDGVKVAIIGKPNVGKSSLLNAISMRPAAIVSPIPGTTRDIVETTLNIGGYPVILSDTAGLRETTDDIEKEGVRRGMERAKAADLKIIVIDCREYEPHPNFIKSYQENLGFDFHDIEETVIVLNKTDLIPASTFKESGNICAISCSTDQGMDTFLSLLTKKVEKLCINPSSVNPSFTQARHRSHLTKCSYHLEQYLDLIDTDVVLAAEELRRSVVNLGKITGKITSEEILDVIFRDFCIGK